MPEDSWHCPYCDEVIPDNGSPPANCPFAGGAACPVTPGGLVDGPADPFGDTVVYPRGRADALNDTDGFPEVDDLTGGQLGQYHIDTIIGRGSMGRVYRAEHQGLHRPCAIKVMNPGLVERQPQIVERFWAEARAVANLAHPNVVMVHNLGTDRGYHYLEMEYVPGGVSLKELIREEGALPPLRTARIVRQVAQALGAAHRAGLVHRDVKPSNVLMAPDGQAKLADFGLVRRLDDAGIVGATVAGTPTFMAPELFQGAPADARSDLYALGVMYFYLLSARLPFASESLRGLVRMHRREPPPDIRRLAPDVPDEAADILARLMAKRPEDRFETADELDHELHVLISHLRDTDALVREAVEGLDGLLQGGRDHFRMILRVPGDRLQEVYIELHRGRKGEPLLSVFSVCGPADPKHYEYALRLNAQLTHGSLSVREVHGQSMFVMTRTFSRTHVTAADIRASVQEIARRGDRLEQQLTSIDIF